jgi:chromate transporter
MQDFRALSNNILKVLAVLAFVAIFVLKVPFPYIVLSAALIGYMGAKFLLEMYIRVINYLFLLSI